MATDITKVTKTCVQYRQYAKGGPKKIPLRLLPRGWSGDVAAMDLFGPLPKTNRGATIILVLIDPFTKWVGPIVLKRAEVPDVIARLRDIWMPRRGVPAVLLSDNGPQLVAAVLRDSCARGFAKSRARRTTPGNSVAESNMRH